MGYIVLIISGFWTFLLLTRVQSLFGQKFFVVSGSNVFDAKGFAINNGVYGLFWAIAIVGFVIGLKMMVSGSRAGIPSGNEGTGQKKCPMCAETIRWEALVCKHCGHKFSENEVKQMVEQHSRNQTAKYCPRCNMKYPIEERVCQVCRMALIVSSPVQSRNNETTVSISSETAGHFVQSSKCAAAKQCPRCNRFFAEHVNECPDCALKVV